MVGAVSGGGMVVKFAGSRAKGFARSRLDNALPQTGSGNFSGNGDDLYDAIRASNTDVRSIANNTGYKPANIQKVKDHVFYQRHLLDRFVDKGYPARFKRFDSDLGQAKAWLRLENGSHTDDDLRFLFHETAEAWYMRNHGPSYNAAHNAASRRFPTPPLP